jgi:hypothetical protein
MSRDWDERAVASVVVAASYTPNFARIRTVLCFARVIIVHARLGPAAAVNSWDAAIGSVLIATLVAASSVVAHLLITWLLSVSHTLSPSLSFHGFG